MDTVVTHREIDVPSLPLKRIPSILYNILYIQKKFICLYVCYIVMVIMLTHFLIINLSISLCYFRSYLYHCTMYCYKEKKDAYMGNIFDTLAARRSS